MTEERIKELAEEYWQKHILPNVDKWSGVQQFVRTVAAEAREEGIEEREIFRTALELLVPECNGIAKQALEEAERLKEKP